MTSENISFKIAVILFQCSSIYFLADSVLNIVIDIFKINN